MSYDNKIKLGDKVIILRDNDGFRGYPAKVTKEDHGKYQVMSCDGYYLEWFSPQELMKDKVIMLSDVLDNIARVSNQKDDDSYYDYEEEYFSDDEYLGWQTALNILTEALLKNDETNS